MSSLGTLKIPGYYGPEDYEVLKNVYGRIVAEPWVSTDPEVRSDFARYIISMYERGLWTEKGLYSLCIVAARAKFSNITVSAESHQTASDR